ncbi:MAG TPA: monovalent cation/H+ antiporter complex subunit F [Ignavibacteriaceae bacterium]|nr:monovalent cation/H+ antiporter complex subunit F [Ignavibacteriaceae bacterium]
MNFLYFATEVSIILIGLSLLIICVRLAIGPSIEDRIVAIDLFFANAIGFVGVYAIHNNTTTFLDVGIIIALLAFLGTIAFSFYLERRTRK